MIETKNIFDKVVYVICAIILLIFFILNCSFQKIVVEIWYFFIGAISFIWFVKEKGFITINKMIAIYLLFFCSLAPLVQYENKTTYWGMQVFDDNIYIYANILIVLFILVYLFFYYFVFKIKKTKINSPFLCDFTITIMVMISLLSLVYLLLSGDIISFNGGSSSVDRNSTMDLIIKFIRFIPVASFILLFFSFKNNKTNLSKTKFHFFSFILVFISLINFNPVSGTMGRYLVLAVYLMLIYLLFYKYKYESLLLIGIFFGFFIIFPSMNFFKYHSLSEIGQFSKELINFASNDYDSYYMFLVSIKTVNQNGFLFLGNILTALLNFVPRSIWNGKLMPSGEIISTLNNATFTNVSCPLFAEYYLSFGVFGIIILTIIFSFIVKMISEFSRTSIMFFGINIIFVGMILPIMRGSLLPMASFTTILIISFIFMYLLQKYIKIKF